MNRWMMGAGVVAAAAVVAVAATIAFAGGGDEGEWVTVPMMIEYSEENGSPIPHDEQISNGTVRARRTPAGVEASVKMHSLVPGGVYTIWIGVLQETDMPGSTAFLISGGGAVADDDGEIDIPVTSASVGDESIRGWVLNEEPFDFAPLHSPMAMTMRVEAVYHGQADKAGDELDTWLADFWTGEPGVCADPIGSQGTGAVPSLPYCAGFYGASVPEPAGDSG